MAGELRPVVFALDAGATTTRAVVVDEDGVVLWREQSAGASLTRRDFDEALEQIRWLWEEAAGYVEDLPSRLRGVAAGFAGGRSTSVRMEMGRRLADLCSGSDLSSTLPVTVTHDAHIALLGAHGSEGAACVLISGTGSICMARDEQGTTTLAGGWGWPLGDEGSAVWLGWRAARRALAAWEESRPTPLAALLLEAWDIDPDQAGDPHSVMRRAAGAARDPDLYARLAPGVFTCAGDGDPDALELVQETGLELGTLISQACNRLGFESGREVPVRSRAAWRPAGNRCCATPSGRVPDPTAPI